MAFGAEPETGRTGEAPAHAARDLDRLSSLPAEATASDPTEQEDEERQANQAKVFGQTREGLGRGQIGAESRQTNAQESQSHSSGNAAKQEAFVPASGATHIVQGVPQTYQYLYAVPLRPHVVTPGWTSVRRPPGPKGMPFLGNLLDFRRDVLRYYSEWARQYGDIVALRLGPWPAVMLNHSDYIEYVLVDHHPNFIKFPFFFRHVDAIFGQGLLTSEGELWQRQRRLMAPAFQAQRLAGYGETRCATLSACSRTGSRATCVTSMQT